MFLGLDLLKTDFCFIHYLQNTETRANDDLFDFIPPRHRIRLDYRQSPLHKYLRIADARSTGGDALLPNLFPEHREEPVKNWEGERKRGQERIQP